MKSVIQEYYNYNRILFIRIDNNIYKIFKGE